MVELLIWRHAKTERGAGLPDHDRRLLPIGRDDALDVARALLERNLVPDIVLCSSAARAQETAYALYEVLADEARAPERFDLPELYSADEGDYISLVRLYGGGASRILIVGHNPTAERFVSCATGDETTMKTGALAVLHAAAAGASDLPDSAELTLSEMILPLRRR
ncbi:MAG: SixA phosphatase family protein [Spirochaetota bacterium]